MHSWPVLLVASSIIACGGSEGTMLDASTGIDTATGSSTADSSGSSTGAQDLCADVPSPAPEWLTDYQDDIVARLAGASELTPGVTLADRSSEANRMAARDFLFDELASLGLPPLLQDYSATGANVYAELAPDAEVPSDEVIVLGAHFDTVENSPGANDNATGVAAVLAAAAHLAEVPCRTRAVQIVLFDEEEIGLRGSDAFAQQLADDGVTVHSAHTLDQLGWDADGNRIVELEQPSPGLFELYAAAAVSLDLKVVQTGTGGTDHVSFRLHGFPAVGVTEEFASGDTTPHYHTDTDTHDTVDLAYMASATALVSAALTRLARGEE